MARAYFGSRFSPNMTRTPEGYLICHNVPIARTGTQEYLPDEIGVDAPSRKPLQVARDDTEVFDQATLASFEGKPVTDGHPSSWVTPDNVSSYLRGVTTNVRQGAGDENDLTLADLIIYDPSLVNDILNGKREVSCGYDCEYEPMGEGGYAQRRIRGNHVAIVPEGRAGDRVAIKDQKPKTGGKESMPINRNSLFGKIMKALATTDATPEEMAEANKMMTAEKDAEPPAATAAAPADPILAALAEIQKTLAALVASDKQVHAEAKPDALDALVAEVAPAGKPDAGEESKTIPAETIADEAPVSSPEDRPENPIPGADTAAFIKHAVAAIRPVIAALPEKERASATQKAADALRAQLKAAGVGSRQDAYAKLNNPAKPAKDAATKTQEQLDAEYGETLKKYHRQPIVRR